MLGFTAFRSYRKVQLLHINLFCISQFNLTYNNHQGIKYWKQESLERKKIKDSSKDTLGVGFEEMKELEEHEVDDEEELKAELTVPEQDHHEEEIHEFDENKKSDNEDEKSDNGDENFVEHHLTDDRLTDDDTNSVHSEKPEQEIEDIHIDPTC